MNLDNVAIHAQEGNPEPINVYLAGLANFQLPLDITAVELEEEQVILVGENLILTKDEPVALRAIAGSGNRSVLTYHGYLRGLYRAIVDDQDAREEKADCENWKEDLLHDDCSHQGLVFDYTSNILKGEFPVKGSIQQSSRFNMLSHICLKLLHGVVLGVNEGSHGIHQQKLTTSFRHFVAFLLKDHFQLHDVLL